MLFLITTQQLFLPTEHTVAEVSVAEAAEKFFRDPRSHGSSKGPLKMTEVSTYVSAILAIDVTAILLYW